VLQDSTVRKLMEFWKEDLKENLWKH
jgi:hypothetical protein